MIRDNYNCGLSVTWWNYSTDFEQSMNVFQISWTLIILIVEICQIIFESLGKCVMSGSRIKYLFFGAQLHGTFPQNFRNLNIFFRDPGSQDRKFSHVWTKTSLILHLHVMTIKSRRTKVLGIEVYQQCQHTQI